MKFPRFHTLFLAILILSAVPHSSLATNNTDSLFITQAREYVDNFYFPSNPAQATSLGIHQYDSKIEDLSQIGIQNKITQLKQYQSRIQAIDPQLLSENMKADRELVLNNIRSQLLGLEKIQLYKKDPDLYSGTITNSAFVIMERKFASAEDRLHALVAREKLMPDLLQEARHNLHNPPPIYTQIAIEQLPGIIRFFQTDVPAAFKDVQDLKLQKEFAASNAAVITALQHYQAWLQSYLLPRSQGDFRLGVSLFRQKLQYDEMVDLPLNQLLTIGMTNMRQNQKALAQLTKEIDPSKTPRQLINALGKEHPAPNDLLDTFRNSFNELISFIEKKNIITLPSPIRPIVEETPPFLRAVTFASMDTPGPFETVANEAYFNVTLPAAHWNNERVKEFMAQFNFPVITNIAVHEAYPGHYVQFLWVRKNEDYFRKIFGAASNAEGWAHYCEQMMVDEGLGKDQSNHQAQRLRLGLLQEALLRNARYIVAIKMHTGQMSFKQAQDFFVQEGYQTPTVALVETKRGTLDPTYLYYTLGKLEILKLRTDLKKKLGPAFNLKKFHDDFMKQGFPPIKIVRKTMLQDDSPVL